MTSWNFPAAEIAEEMRRLGVSHARLDAFDGVFDMAVGDVDVGPAVEIVIEEEAAEAEGEQARRGRLRIAALRRRRGRCARCGRSESSDWRNW